MPAGFSLETFLSGCSGALYQLGTVLGGYGVQSTEELLYILFICTSMYSHSCFYVAFRPRGLFAGPPACLLFLSHHKPGSHHTSRCPLSHSLRSASALPSVFLHVGRFFLAGERKLSALGCNQSLPGYSLFLAPCWGLAGLSWPRVGPGAPVEWAPQAL